MQLIVVFRKLCEGGLIIKEHIVIYGKAYQRHTHLNFGLIFQYMREVEQRS